MKTHVLSLVGLLFSSFLFGQISVNGSQIKDVADPVDDQDAVTLSYIRNLENQLNEIKLFIDNDGDGFSENQGDCNDTDSQISPDIIEIPCDQVDNNCNGIVDEKIDNSIVGSYRTESAAFYRIDTFKYDENDWPRETKIDNVSKNIYRVQEYVGPYDGNEWYFHVETNYDGSIQNGAIITYLTEYNGDPILLNGQPIITCQSNPSDMSNVECLDTNYVTVDGDDITLTMTYGYFTAGSGPREFYQVLNKIDDSDCDGQFDSDEILCGSDPNDSNSTSPDSDSDGTCDFIDEDDDNDGTPDELDDYPLIPFHFNVTFDWVEANPNALQYNGGYYNACDNGVDIDVYITTTPEFSWDDVMGNYGAATSACPEVFDLSSLEDGTYYFWSDYYSNPYYSYFNGSIDGIINPTPKMPITSTISYLGEVQFVSVQSDADAYSGMLGGNLEQFNYDNKLLIKLVIENGVWTASAN